MLTLPLLKREVVVSEGMDHIALEALEKAIRADERAKSVGERMDRFEDTTAVAFRDAAAAQALTADKVGTLSVDVGKINARVGMAAAFGSLVGGGAIAVVVGLLRHGGTKSALHAFLSFL